MDRRKFLIGSATGATAALSGAFFLANAFAPPKLKEKLPELILPNIKKTTAGTWLYHPLDSAATGDVAYHLHREGSCMYATFGSILTQLAEQHGEPYASFPLSMMKYGASGIGGYGSICGALNGAAAIMGLFVENKSHRNALIEDFFTWYERTELPIYTPEQSKQTVATSISNSVLCHASTANWVKESGLKIDSKKRSERCSRLTADVAQKTVATLNQYFEGRYEASLKVNEETAECAQCHSKKGKLANIRGKMECASCHEKSMAHTLFADVHYKFME
ncbi:hypothetical protein GF373_13515 [bacterium]|nr:hypothetical protein [bacterium]